MTHKEIEEVAKELAMLLKEKPRLRVNGLLTPNKTERDYYCYRMKGEKK